MSSLSPLAMTLVIFFGLLLAGAGAFNKVSGTFGQILT